MSTCPLRDRCPRPNPRPVRSAPGPGRRACRCLTAAVCAPRCGRRIVRHKRGFVKVLYVCTANICRSPAAAALLREAGLPTVEVVSAGTQAVVGSPACSIVRELPGHESQPLTAGLIESADLVLTAAREHRTAVVEMYRRRAPGPSRFGRRDVWRSGCSTPGWSTPRVTGRLRGRRSAPAGRRASRHGTSASQLGGRGARCGAGMARPWSPPRPTAGGGHDGWLSHRGIPTMSRTRTFWGPAGTRWPTSNCRESTEQVVGLLRAVQ